MDEFDDLLGTEPEAPKPSRRRRPRKPLIPEQPEYLDLSELAESDFSARQKAIKMASGGMTFVDAGELKKPVTMNFLALVFDMDPATVKKRLLTCPNIGTGRGNNKVYDFKTAVAYLVPPKMDIDAYIKSLDPNKLPNHINKTFWEAKRTRLKFMIEAGEAWLTEKVLSKFGEAAMMVKNRMQLVVEEMRELGLTDEQSNRLRDILDKFQNDFHADLVQNAEDSHTPNLADDDEGFGEGQS